jgi:hypothetical protein
MSRQPAYATKLIEGQAIAMTKLEHMTNDAKETRRQVEQLDAKMDGLHERMAKLESFETRLEDVEKGVGDYRRTKGIGVFAWVVMTTLGSTLGGLVLRKLGWSA